MLSFNPCFIGSPIHTNYNLFLKELEALFQSLFYWKSYSYQVPEKAKLRWTPCFNPCFIGSPIHTGLGESEYITNFRSFNPCFIGSPIHTLRFELSSIAFLMFQSLFYWKSYSYAFFVLESCHLTFKFQSLFYWKSYSYC